MNLWWASVNRRLLIFSAFYCKKLMFRLHNVECLFSSHCDPFLSLSWKQTFSTKNVVALHNMLSLVHVVGGSGTGVLKLADSGVLNCN